MFRREREPGSYSYPNESREDHVYAITFVCSRDKEHERLFFVVKVKDNQIGKIGQYPSLADLHLPDVQKYRKVLTDEKHREFVRGIGLAAHGIGIGAFVYLRRVFEHLVEEAHMRAAAAGMFDNAAYDDAKMDARIKMLAGYLPGFLVENRSLYVILSQGIHALSEDECLQHFDVVRVGIELILDEKLQAQQRESKLKTATAAIGNVRGVLKR